MQKFMLIAKPRHLIANFFYFLSLPALLISLSAHADDQDALNVIAGVSQQHDDNLFRISSSKRSDNITSTYAGIRLDKLYSLQRFKLDYTLTLNKYQNNNFLDFNAQEYKAAWLWALTPYLTGTLSATRTEQLNDFKDYTNFTVQNIRTTENQHFEADFSPHGNWHLLGGLTRTNLTNSQTFNEESDFTMNSLDAGFKYVFSSGSAITLMGHDRNGANEKRKLNPILFYDTGFEETEGEAKLDWLISGKSKINMRLAHVARAHDHFSQRDYSGAIGSLEYTWMPTGKLQVAIVASSDLSSYQTIYSSYARDDTLSVSPMYSISAKISARASASISERSFLGEGVIPSLGRVDKNKSASVGLDWAPYRSISLGGNIQRSSRSSTLPGLDFTDTTVGLSANLYF